MAPRACSASVPLGGPFVHTERVSTGLCVNRRAGLAGNAGQEVALGCLGPRQSACKACLALGCLRFAPYCGGGGEWEVGSWFLGFHGQQAEAQ